MTQTRESPLGERAETVVVGFGGHNDPSNTLEQATQSTDDLPNLPACLDRRGPAPSAFDYSTLTPDLAGSLRQQAKLIRSRIANNIEIIIQTGRDLRAAKQHLDHGQFTNWVEAELGINIRTAQRYMGAAQWGEDKHDTVSLLPPGAIYRLSAKSAPPEITIAVIAKAKAGEFISDDDVTGMLREARRLRRQDKNKQRLAETKSKKYRDRRAADRQRAEEECQRRDVDAREMAREIIRRVGAENARFIAGAFREHWSLGEALRLEIEAES